MRGMQVLSPQWRESLAQFCDAWSEYERLVIECLSAPFIVTGSKDNAIANPIFGLKRKAWDAVLRMGREFGYTPASKADIRAETKPQKNEKSRFFKGAS